MVYGECALSDACDRAGGGAHESVGSCCGLATVHNMVFLALGPDVVRGVWVWCGEIQGAFVTS